MNQTLTSARAQFPDPALDEVLRGLIGLNAHEFLAVAILAVMAIQVAAYLFKHRRRQ